MAPSILDNSHFPSPPRSYTSSSMSGNGLFSGNRPQKPIVRPKQSIVNGYHSMGGGDPDSRPSSTASVDGGIDGDTNGRYYDSPVDERQSPPVWGQNGRSRAESTSTTTSNSSQGLWQPQKQQAQMQLWQSPSASGKPREIQDDAKTPKAEGPKVGLSLKEQMSSPGKKDPEPDNGGQSAAYTLFLEQRLASLEGRMESMVKSKRFSQLREVKLDDRVYAPPEEPSQWVFNIRRTELQDLHNAFPVKCNGSKHLLEVGVHYPKAEVRGILPVFKSASESRPYKVCVNSPLLIKILSYLSGETLPRQSVVFVHPFKLFMGFEKQLREFYSILESRFSKSPQGLAAIPIFEDQDFESREALHQMQLLMELFDKDFSSIFELRRQAKKGTLKSISFHDLRHLYHTGDIVRSSANSTERLMAYKIVTTSDGDDAFRIDAYHYGFDGCQFGPLHASLRVDRFDGERPITSLPFFPLHFSKDVELNLIERGQKFVGLAKRSLKDQGVHQTYRARSLDLNADLIESDVIVDSDSDEVSRIHRRSPLNVSYPLSGIHRPMAFGFGAFKQNPSRSNKQTDAPVHDDQITQLRALQTLPPLPSTSQNLHLDEQFILCPFEIPAFVLRSKSWSIVHVDYLRDTPREDGLRNLALPEAHKEQLLAICSGSATGPTHNILLHGTHGTGKTATAICLARHMKRPILSVDASDFRGISEVEQEQPLGRLLRLAQRWRCIILLDNADAILDQGRNKHSVTAAFLDLLDTYHGLKVLTTNHIASLDGIIRCRVHFSLRYEPLDLDSTLEVWRLQLGFHERAGAVEIDEKQRVKIMTFARQHYQHLAKVGAAWNGRQIEKAVQTAVAFAGYKAKSGAGFTSSGKGKGGGKVKVRLTEREFRKCAAAFDEYLDGVDAEKETQVESAGCDKGKKEKGGYRKAAANRYDMSDSEDE